MVALRIESTPPPAADAEGIFRRLLAEVVHQSETAELEPGTSINQEGLAKCRALVDRGTEQQCQETLAFILMRQEQMIASGLFTHYTPDVAALNERIRAALEDFGPEGDADVMSVLRPIREALAEACLPKRCLIAGSLRRGKRSAHDADIVCMPRRGNDLFGGPSSGYPDFEVAIERLLRTVQIRWDTQTKRNGEKQKRFVVPALNDMPLELYITRPDNFGAILAIRTGNPEFTHTFVTRRCEKGLMPNYLRMVEGDLTRYDWRKEQVLETLSVPTEKAFFDALNLPLLPPEQRNAAGIAYLRGLIAQGDWARKEAAR